MAFINASSCGGGMFLEETLLWQTSTTTMGEGFGSKTLSDDYTNYKYIRIDWCNKNYSLGTVTITDITEGILYDVQEILSAFGTTVGIPVEIAGGIIGQIIKKSSFGFGSATIVKSARSFSFGDTTNTINVSRCMSLTTSGSSTTGTVEETDTYIQPYKIYGINLI